MDQEALISVEQASGKYRDGVYVMCIDATRLMFEEEIGVICYPVLNGGELQASIEEPLDVTFIPYLQVGLDEESVRQHPTLREPEYVVTGTMGLAPESFEEKYGTKLGLLLLMSLSRSVQAEISGARAHELPGGLMIQYREPNLRAVELLGRVHDLVAILHSKVYR